MVYVGDVVNLDGWKKRCRKHRGPLGARIKVVPEDQDAMRVMTWWVVQRVGLPAKRQRSGRENKTSAEEPKRNSAQ